MKRTNNKSLRKTLVNYILYQLIKYNCNTQYPTEYQAVYEICKFLDIDMGELDKHDYKLVITEIIDDKLEDLIQYIHYQEQDWFVCIGLNLVDERKDNLDFSEGFIQSINNPLCNQFICECTYRYLINNQFLIILTYDIDETYIELRVEYPLNTIPF